MSATIRKFGWRKQQPDFRDFMLPERNMLVRLPTSVDLRGQMPPIVDQGELGSCTANAIDAVLDYERKRQGEPFIEPSRLFLYYNERVMEKTIPWDAGADIRDGIKSLTRIGCCTEARWPYDISKFADRPGEDCYLEAQLYRATAYHGVLQTSLSLKGALARRFPVVFGVSVYDSFMSEEVSNTGIVPMPGTDQDLVGGVIGGHAVVAVGYDDTRHAFLCRNSWGTKWGFENGWFWLPYLYVLNPGLASDFWVLTAVTQDAIIV